MQPINFADLGLSPIIAEIGPIALRWYSLSYIVGIIIGWWYLLRLLKQPGAPAAARHVDSFVTWITLGIILGGRIGYVLFYDSAKYLADPLSALRLWEGGMSFHGGLIGVIVAVFWFTRVNKLPFLRFFDHVAVAVPPAILLVRLANFINGELWGRPTDGSWGIIFDHVDGLPRHPSQLYEAFLEGPLLFAILWVLFWKTGARQRPGLICGAFTLGYGCVRFFVEQFREPDSQLTGFAAATGLHMGQWLSVPMILVGLYLILTAKGRQAS